MAGNQRPLLPVNFYGLNLAFCDQWPIFYQTSLHACLSGFSLHILLHSIVLVSYLTFTLFFYLFSPFPRPVAVRSMMPKGRAKKRNKGKECRRNKPTRDITDTEMDTADRPRPRDRQRDLPSCYAVSNSVSHSTRWCTGY